MKNSTFAMLLLGVVLVFQTTVLPETLGIEPLSRLVNAGFLVFLVLLLLIGGLQGRISRSYLILLLPSGLVLVGMSQNILRGLTGSSLGLLALLLPWLAVLTVPFMRSFNLERAWLVFYRFMVACSVLALVEYFGAMFGVISLTILENERGVFYQAWMTIFHVLEDGTVYYRMYGVFPEAGDFAMFLLPAIGYALIMRKAVALVIFLPCLYFTDSLGGAAGLAVLLVTFSFWRTLRFPIIPVGLLVTALILVQGTSLSQWFVDEYMGKVVAGSALVREDNIFLFLEGFWGILTNNPFGLPLGGVSGSLTALSETNVVYIGSNFMPYVAFVMGGLFSLFGYLVVICVCILAVVRFFAQRDSDPLLACAFISLPSLLTFLFQRPTILESALFAFLFVPPILVVLRGRTEMWGNGNWMDRYAGY